METIIKRLIIVEIAVDLSLEQVNKRPHSFKMLDDIQVAIYNTIRPQVGNSLVTFKVIRINDSPRE